MSLMILAALLCGGGGAAAVVHMTRMLRASDTCPACERRAMKLVSWRRGTKWPPGKVLDDTSVHRCTACGLEVCRAGNGPLIPRAMWDAGVREAVEIPRVTLVRR